MLYPFELRALEAKCNCIGLSSTVNSSCFCPQADDLVVPFRFRLGTSPGCRAVISFQI
jgi:hypothetical protein